MSGWARMHTQESLSAGEPWNHTLSTILLASKNDFGNLLASSLSLLFQFCQLVSFSLSLSPSFLFFPFFPPFFPSLLPHSLFLPVSLPHPLSPSLPPSPCLLFKGLLNLSIKPHPRMHPVLVFVVEIWGRFNKHADTPLMWLEQGRMDLWPWGQQIPSCNHSIVPLWGDIFGEVLSEWACCLPWPLSSLINCSKFLIQGLDCFGDSSAYSPLVLHYYTILSMTGNTAHCERLKWICLLESHYFRREHKREGRK